MNFQSLPYVEQVQVLLDKAFSRARKRAGQLSGSVTKKTDKVLLKKKICHEKITMVRNVLVRDLQKIIAAYPDFTGLPEFYEQLAKTRLDIDVVKRSLGRIQGVVGQLQVLGDKAQRQVREQHDLKAASKAVDAYYGRVSSLFKRLEKTFATIEHARKVLVTFPALKEELCTIALAGFPNVGKSTLLSRITTSKPKIANYAFTTKTLNVGYYEQGYERFQVVDTPGTLARFERMNAIEQQAYLCLKYAAHLIVVIIDPTETYSLEEQERLLEQVRKHDKPVIIYASKTDVVDKKTTKALREKHGAITSLRHLKRAIKEQLDD
ncbi:50S ribosome-binding GTPase [Candidatus Woesearchaeota archaeon]|nr:50S ribosome-binding GTPase [Candidatus Woesearchaeota archaeon]